MRKDIRLILASNSPRRSELLKGLDLPFENKVFPNIDESYPDTLSPIEVSEYIALKKSSYYQNLVDEHTVVPTADTTVIIDNNILGKPKDKADAYRMLNLLSNRTHHVVTGICLLGIHGTRHFSVTTQVTFRKLTENEINYYIDQYHPFDKAGSYGIQEWIGYIGCTRLEGSYFNVMGLPVQRIYDELEQL